MKPQVFDLITRWRHTRGYGVHSPLAFRIVTECVRPDSRYAYYADSRIEYLYAGDRRRCRQMRLIVRLIDQLRPEEVWMPGAERRAAKVISEAFPSLRISIRQAAPERAGLIVIFGASVSSLPDAITRIFDNSRATALLCIHKSRVAERAVIPSATLTLRGREYTLSVSREGMQPVVYDIL